MICAWISSIQFKLISQHIQINIMILSCIYHRDRGAHPPFLNRTEPHFSLDNNQNQISEAFGFTVCLTDCQSVSLHNDKHISHTKTNDTHLHVRSFPSRCTRDGCANCKLHWIITKIKTHRRSLSVLRLTMCVIVQRQYLSVTTRLFCDLPQSIRTLLYIRASFEHLIGHKKHLWGKLRLTFN